MPVFDFDNGVDGSTGQSTFATPFTLNYTDDEAGGVTFTLSSADTGSTNVSQAFFAGTVTATTFGFTAAAFTIGDRGSDNVFTLKATQTFNATAVNTTAVKLLLGPNLLNSWTIQATLNSVNVGAPIIVKSSQAGSSVTLLTAGSAFNGIKFSTSDGQNGNTMLQIDTLTVNCFLAGTRIATPGGHKPVEALVPGDRVVTADGGTTTVKWLGEQPVPVRLLHPAKINPICISEGALAEGVPARDLWVSQDHAIAIDGLLINAGALVNGSSIYQVAKMPLDGFSYYHIETDAHELILAENCPAESFIDYAGRDSFVNGDEADGTAPIPEMDMPRISAARLVPEAIRERLDERADSMVGTRRVA